MQTELIEEGQEDLEVFGVDEDFAGDEDLSLGGGSGDTDDVDYREQYAAKARMVDSLKQDIHDERKRRQEMEARLKAIEDERQNAQDANLENDIGAARQALAKAFDEGEGADVVEAQERLSELLWRKHQAKAGKPNGANGAGEEKPETDEEPAGGETDARPVADEAKKWVARNKWFNDDDELRAKAVEIASDLNAAGYRNDDPALYRELDKRMRSERQRMRGGRPNAAAVDRAGANGNGDGRQRTLTAQDRREMRVFRLDPSNERHRKAWLERNRPLD